MFKVQIATGSIRRTNIAVSSTAGSTVSHQHQLWSDIQCRGQMLETECVGDKFEMLVTVFSYVGDGIFSFMNMPYIHFPKPVFTWLHAKFMHDAT